MSAITSPDEFIDHTTAMALEEKAKLQKHFTRFDIYFFLICTIVGVDTLGVVAAEGAQGFTWLIFLAVAFFVPYALIVAELGSAFTEEGGSYVWTRLAFGRLVAAVNAVFYWFSNPIWIGATLALLAIATVNEFFFSIGDNSWLFYLVGLAYIWFSVYSAILSFGIGKWIPTLGAWARIFVLGLFVDQHDPLRDQERAQPAEGRRVQADLRAVHRARAGAVLQLRRLRAAERGGRRDEEPPEGRAVHRAPRGRHGDPALRPADPGRHRRAAEGRDHRRRRLHDRGRVGLHGLRRRRRA